MSCERRDPRYFVIAIAVSAMACVCSCDRHVPRRPLVVGFLLNVADAESESKKRVLRDEDQDGVGEYLSFVEMKTLGLDWLDSALPERPNAYLNRVAGYDVLLCVPGGNVPVDDEKPSDSRERFWWCYAVPCRIDRDNCRAFLIDESGNRFCRFIGSGGVVLSPFMGVHLEQIGGRPRKTVLWQPYVDE